ncbi:MAG: N(4)-(beta-N-acetylglucosaminyl)-L-asparaginase [Bacteroidetes bacterium]|nr:N(4)-(beta-N-acetylglucosaminyl)-L-asparaginase [Bacteroidota bacterium]
MITRRKFLKNTTLTSALLITGVNEAFVKNNEKVNVKPLVISTWKHGLAANNAAWKIITENGKSIDAVEQGVKVSESDPEVQSVGYGGLPDRDGNVTLDASIMDENGNCGSVAFLQHIKNPISVARLVMDKTPHVMLVGEGALKFALNNGFKKENLLTEKSRIEWEKWKIKKNYEPEKIDINNHDTIGMLAIDNFGNLSGACTTSGLAWKYHGRVGDSPIIGAGMFVDNEIGAACATGKGEAVIKIAGSLLIVELMRNGKTPMEACKEAINRIVKKQKDFKDFQVGFIAINQNNQIGAYSIQKGFQYALYIDGENKLIDSDYYLK